MRRARPSTFRRRLEPPQYPRKLIPSAAESVPAGLESRQIHQVDDQDQQNTGGCDHQHPVRDHPRPADQVRGPGASPTEENQRSQRDRSGDQGDFQVHVQAFDRPRREAAILAINWRLTTLACDWIAPLPQSGFIHKTRTGILHLAVPSRLHARNCWIASESVFGERIE